MMFLYAIFCQWLSRGCLLKCFLEEEKWQIFLVVFLISIVFGSPIQGDMSDKGSRKKVLLVTTLCVILSLMIVMIGRLFCSHETLPIAMIVAVIINGLFGKLLSELILRKEPLQSVLFAGSLF